MALALHNNCKEVVEEVEEATVINGATTESVFESSKLGIYVHSISDFVLKRYNEIKSMGSCGNITKNSRVSISKCKKVRPRALIRTLENFANECKCAALKEDVKQTIFQIEDMLTGGEARLFVCHSKQNLKSALEFVCVAVRKYKVEGGEEAVDYCLTTFSYSKMVDVVGASVGLTTIGSAAGLGALTVATGGGLAVACALGCLVFGALGGIITGASFDTSIADDMKTNLEANFLYELVSRGHAILSDDGRLYITNE